MRPTIDATLIAELRSRVIAHNDGKPRVTVKLGELKKVYEKNFRGQQPGRRAMERVDAYLAKAETFDESEHPRAKDGQFSGVPQAKNEKEHAKLQASNPTYRALTSDTIAEHRGEQVGALGRVVGALAIGTGVVAGLAHGKPNGATANAIKWAAGKVGRYSAGIPTALATYGGTVASRGVRGAIKARAGKNLPETTYKAAGRATEAVANVGEKVGRAIGGGAFKASSALVRSTIHASGGGTPRARAAAFFAAEAKAAKAKGVPAISMRAGTKKAIRADRIGSNARKVGGFAALAGLTGWSIDRGLKGGALDPEEYGRSYDSFSYRTVQKLAQDGDLGQARDEMMVVLRKGGDVNELRKSGFWSAGGRLALPALAAIGGGAIAGGAAHLGQRHAGNPYRDEDGKFASKENAVNGGAALAGAALAAGGVYLAIRNHNSKALVSGLTRVGALLARHMRSVHPDTVGNVLNGTTKHIPGGLIHPKVSEAIMGRSKRVAELLETSKDAPIKALRDHVASTATYGRLSPAAYKEAVRRDVNAKLANAAMDHDDFLVPVKDKLTSMKDLRATSMSEGQLRAHVENQFNAMGDKEVKAATAGMKNQNAAALIQGEHAARATKLADVDQKIAGHFKDVDTAIAHEVTAKGARDAAAADHSAASANLKLASPDNQDAAKAIHDGTKAALDVAETKHAEALSNLTTLKSKGPQVKLNDGTSVQPASAAQLAHTEKSLKAAADKHATNIANKEIMKIRAGLERGMIDKANVQTSVLTRAAGTSAVPSHARPAANEVMRTAVVKKELDGKLAEAEKRLAAVPKGADRAAERKAATDAVKAARAAIDNHRAVTTESAGKLADALNAKPATGPVREGGFLGRMQRDLHSVYRAGTDPVRSFLNGPTAQGFGEFVSSIPSHLSDTAVSVKDGAVAGYRATFQKPGKESGTYVYSPGKILAAAPVVAVAYETAKTIFRDASDAISNISNHGVIDGIGRSKVTGLQIDNKIDPVTGEGFVALTAPDPKNKNERILLYGEKNTLDRDKILRQDTLHAGARLSDVKNRLQEMKNNQGSGGNNNGGSGGGRSDADGMSQDVQKVVNGGLSALNGMKKDAAFKEVPSGDGNGTMRFRNGSASEGKAAAKAFLEHVSQKAKSDPLGALSDVFSRHGQVLTQHQAAVALTGYHPDGNSAGTGVFKNEAFKGRETDEIAGALGEEIDKHASKLAGDSKLRSHMHNAVSAIGAAKNLGADEMKALHAKIKGDNSDPDPEPRAEPQHNSAGPSEPRVDRSNGGPSMGGAKMDHSAFQAHVRNNSGDLEKYLGVKHDDKETFKDALFGLSFAAHSMAAENGHNLGPATSLSVVNKALRHVLGEDHDHEDSRAIMLHAVLTEDLGEFKSAFEKEIDNHVQRGGVHKSADYDDLDVLIKLNMGDFADSLHPRVPRGSPDGGEFTSGHGGSTPRQRVVREATDGLIEGGQKAERGMSAKPQAWHEPVRLGSELGTAVGNELGYAGAGAALKAIAPRFVGGIPGLAIGAIGSMVGGSLFSSAGEAAGRGAHALVGSKAPKEAIAPEYHGAGEQAAELAGSFAGQYIGAGIGGALGGLAGGIGAGPGALVGGAIGNYAGSVSNRALYNWFAGFDDSKAAQIMQRYQPKQPRS